MISLIGLTVVIACFAVPPSEKETCYDVLLETPAGWVDGFCYDPANPIRVPDGRDLLSAAEQCKSVTNGVLIALNTALVPDDDPVIPPPCDFTWSGSGYDEYALPAECVTDTVTVVFTTTGTGGLVSQDVSNNPEPGQLTIRVLDNPPYVGRVQVRLQGAGFWQTYTLPILNDGNQHTIQVVSTGADVDVILDGVSQGSRPFPQPIATMALPLVIGAHCAYCTNGANDVRDVLTNGSVSISFSGSAPQPPDPPVAGDTTISWDAPTMNVDGSILDDLAGFRMYCGSGQWVINDPLATQWDLDSSLTGTFTCEITAYDTSGNESEKSGSVTVNR